MESMFRKRKNTLVRQYGAILSTKEPVLQSELDAFIKQCTKLAREYSVQPGRLRSAVQRAAIDKFIVNRM